MAKEEIYAIGCVYLQVGHKSKTTSMTRNVIRPRDIRPKEVYEISWMRDFIVLGQLTYAFRTFQLVDITKNIEKLKIFITSKDYLDTKKRFKYLKDNDFLFYRLFDSIKLGIVFENYFKSKLLINGYIIHKIKPENDKLKKLIKQQYKRPIDKNELIKIVGDASDIKNFITDNTLNYSTILNSNKYCKVFMIKQEIIDFLSQLNTERNKLHLFYSETITFSQNEVDRFVDLMDLIKYDITYLQRVLLEKFDSESKSRIPIKF